MKPQYSLVFLDVSVCTCTEGRAIINIWGLPEGAVCPADIMVVSTDDYWSLRVKVCINEP